MTTNGGLQNREKQQYYSIWVLYHSCLSIWSASNILGFAGGIIHGSSWFDYSWLCWYDFDTRSFQLPFGLVFPSFVSNLASFPALSLQVLVTILVTCQELTSHDPVLPLLYAPRKTPTSLPNRPFILGRGATT